MSDITYNPREIGINGATLPSAVGGLESSVIAVDGAKLVKLHFSLSWAAATDVRFKVYTYDVDNALWEPHQTVSVAAGTSTYSTYEGVRATGGADFNFPVTLEVEGEQAIKLFDVYGTGATTDTLVCSAEVVMKKGGQS